MYANMYTYILHFKAFAYVTNILKTVHMYIYICIIHTEHLQDIYAPLSGMLVVWGGSEA